MKLKTIMFLLLTIIFLPFITFDIEAKSIIEDQWKQIIKNNKMILETNPGDIESRFKLAVAYANMGDIKSTMDELEILQKQKGTKKTIDFIERYQELHSANPTDLVTLNYLAFAYYIAYQFNRSKVFFEMIIELDPEHTMAYNYLALVHGTLSEYDEAIKKVEQARKIKDSQFSHLILGMIYYKQGNMFKAMWHLGRSGKLGMELVK